MPDIPTGAVVTAAQAVSRFKPWVAVRRHDRLVRHEYEDLLTFAHDELQAEARALDEVRNELAARGMLRSGAFAAGQLRVREEYAKRWRDFRRASDRRIEEMKEAEGITVRTWRLLTRKPWPKNPDAEQLRGLTRAWEDESVRRDAVADEVAPVQREEQERAVWFSPEEKVWDVDQAATYRGQIGNNGPGDALGVTAQMVAETSAPVAEPVEVGNLASGTSTQREFTVECPHPRLFCLLSWRNGAGEAFSYRTNQVFPANPIAN